MCVYACVLQIYNVNAYCLYVMYCVHIAPTQFIMLATLMYTNTRALTRVTYDFTCASLRLGRKVECGSPLDVCFDSRAQM